MRRQVRIERHLAHLGMRAAEEEGRHGDRQGELGEEQGRLGEAQGRLGAQQERLIEEGCASSSRTSTG